MNLFHPNHYFHLEGFSHATIFASCQQVWEVLPQLENYLKSLNLGQIEVDIPEGVILEHPELISIGPGTVIEPGVYIRGPCVIGKNCTVRHGAYIRGNLLTGDNCLIGHTTEVKNCILLNYSKAAHFAYLGDTILGNRVNLGAGVKCANLKLDGSDIILHVNGQPYATGLRKMGAIIGDDSQIGCNSVTNPGTLLGKNCSLMPCINFGGVVPDESKISIEIRPKIVSKNKKS